MILCFTLTMPGVASWNGKWSGEGKFYAKIVKKDDSKKAHHAVEELLKQGVWHYRWDDGWAAMIMVKLVTPSAARSIQKQTQGFCGYDWMVDSILTHGRILARHELPKLSVTA